MSVSEVRIVANFTRYAIAILKFPNARQLNNSAAFSEATTRKFYKILLS